MDVEAPRGLLRVFGEVEDPRVERTRLHRLSDILVITLCDGTRPARPVLKESDSRPA